MATYEKNTKEYTEQEKEYLMEKYPLAKEPKDFYDIADHLGINIAQLHNAAVHLGLLTI